jgi:hypothetical protein
MNIFIIDLLSIVVPSAIIGAFCGYFIRGGKCLIFAIIIPWFGLLAVLLFEEYCMPYEGGGASMWPVVQLFGGTTAAVTGLFSCAIFREIRRKVSK